jgi:hypothetical protein
MELMLYHWQINDIDIKILLPSYGLICGNFNIAEKQHEFSERLAKFPAGAIVHRIGVCYA